MTPEDPGSPLSTLSQEAETAAIDATSVRGRRLTLSFATSVISKVGSVAVLAFAMPLAISALGKPRYGAYSALVAGISWLSIVNFGAGPALTRAIAKSAGEDDLDGERRLYSNALAIVAVCAAITTLALVGLFFLNASVGILGPAVRPFPTEAGQGLLWMAVLVPLIMVAGVSDAIYVGHQQQYVTNAWSLAYSLLGIPAFLAVRAVSSSIPAMVLAMYGPLALTKVGGFVQLLAQRRHLRFRFPDVRRSVAAPLVFSGAAFFMLTAGSYLHTQLAVYVAATKGANPAAEVGVLMTMYNLAISVVTMGTGPLWPALIDAKQRGDERWLRRALGTTAKLSVGGAIVVFVTFALAAPPLAGSWYHIPLHDARLVGWMAGLYVAMCALENVLITLSIALGTFRTATKIFVLRTLAAAALYLPAMNLFGIPGLFAVGSLTIVLGPLPLMLRAIRGVLGNGSPPEAPVSAAS